MVTESDVVIALSNSGETGEVLHILPSLRRIGAKLIAMVGNADSALARNSDVTLDVGVSKEAWPVRVSSYFEHYGGFGLRRCFGFGAAI